MKEYKRPPRNDDCVPGSAPREVTFHKLAMGHDQALQVNREGPILGIFKLNDVFEQIGKKCESWNKDRWQLQII